jgi:hypothetical protein
MTGATPTITFNKAGSGNNNIIAAQTNGSLRWNIMLGNSALESGGDYGSDFTITAIGDGGSSTGTAIKITRKTALITIAGDPTTALGVATKQYVDNASIDCGTF